MRCLSAFASFGRYIHTHTHKRTRRYILRNGKTYLLLHPVATAAAAAAVFSAEGPSRRQQSSINLATAQRLVSCISQIRMPLVRCLCLQSFLRFFSSFLFLLLHFICTGNPSRCLWPLRVSCGCVAHDKRSINSKVGASPRLAN